MDLRAFNATDIAQSSTSGVLAQLLASDHDVAENHYSDIDAAFFSGAGGENKVFALSDEQVGDLNHWFVIGDIHGDFYALHKLMARIASLCPDFRLLFLGDLVDRGPHAEACFLYIAKLAAALPGRVIWLAGNHDIGLCFEEARGQFSSDVAPSEFVSYLNADGQNRIRRKELGLKFIQVAEQLPRAVLFPGGLLATHGGIPLTDLQKQLPSPVSTEDGCAWLNSKNALKDFTWTRISRYRTKLANRYSTGCQYGYADFAAFCLVTKEFFPVTGLLTGHEHPDEGFDSHPEWSTNRALTLTGFGFGHHYGSAEAFLDGYRPNLFFARLNLEAFPQITNVPVNRQDLQLFFEKHLAAQFLTVAENNAKLI